VSSNGSLVSVIDNRILKTRLPTTVWCLFPV